MEIPTGVKAALKALATVPATVEGLAVYVTIGTDASRPTAVRKRALFKGRLLGEQLLEKAERRVTVQAKVEARKVEAQAKAEADGFDSVREHKRWLNGEIVEGKPLPIKVLGARHGGALDADPLACRFGHVEFPTEVPNTKVQTPKCFYGPLLGPGRAPYSAVRAQLASTYRDRDGNYHPFVSVSN
jgi:hypothetical protein